MVGDTHFVNWNPASSPFSNIDATVGQSITFEYDSGSDIVAFGSKKHYDKCNMARSKQMATSSQGGGEGGSNAFSTKLNQPGVLYLASTNGCAAGQKLVLSIAAGGCTAHSHDPSCSGAHAAHGSAAEEELVCGEHTHDPRCSNAHTAESHSMPAAAPARAAPAAITVARSGNPCARATGKPSPPRAGGTSTKKKSEIAIVWASPEANAAGATYTIQWGGNTVQTTDTTHKITGLSSRTKYTFKVSASNEFGQSKTISIKAKTK